MSFQNIPHKRKEKYLAWTRLIEKKNWNNEDDNLVLGAQFYSNNSSGNVTTFKSSKSTREEHYSIPGSATRRCEGRAATLAEKAVKMTHTGTGEYK